MNILGLHFGHDAAVAVVVDGHLKSYILRERHSRHKHAMTLDMSCIDMALREAGLDIKQINYCALTSTQNVELMIDNPARLSISYETHPDHKAPCIFHELLKQQNEPLEQQLTHSVLPILYDESTFDKYDTLRKMYQSFYPEYASRKQEDHVSLGCIDNFINTDLWQNPTKLSELSAQPFQPYFENEEVRNGFHYPLVLTMDEHTIPGYFFHHHLAHAAASYYLSPFDEAAIITHDGFANAESYHSGMFYYGSQNKIYPITPHYLTLGGLYERVGIALGLGSVGSPGRLMGLASYGQPRFFSSKFVGNGHDHRAKFELPTSQAWLEHCLSAAKQMGYDLSVYGKREHATAPINVDIAASTQKLFEQTRLLATEVLGEICRSAGRPTKALCLSGGTALNVPSNTQIYNESPFSQVYIEPACDDGGLSIGAALCLYHNVFDHPKTKSDQPYASPYVGANYTTENIEAAISKFEDKIEVHRDIDFIEDAAQSLANNEVIGWYEGCSEAGPRALGHRSIMADPREAQNWPRVNEIKSRELWRPFAPAVLESEVSNWFFGAPDRAPYMLFNSVVRSNQIPAVTHVDNTARIQTVDPTCGNYFKVISRFFELTKVPVVMNTSFNGPGEPIVEKPEEAIAFLLSSKLDAIYVEGIKITRR